MYVFDDATGRIRSIYLIGAPSPPSGHTLSNDPVQNTDIVDSKRNISTSLIQKRDGLKITGSDSVPRSSVGQVAVQKFDGETAADKTAVGDDDPICYALEDPNAFLDKKESALVQGADAVKVAAPATVGSGRFLVFSPELQLLDDEVLFT